MRLWGAFLSALLLGIPAPATHGANCQVALGAHVAAYSPDGVTLAVVLPEGSCPRWGVGISYRGDVVRFIELRNRDDAPVSVSWSPGSRYFAAGVVGTRNAVLVYDTHRTGGNPVRIAAGIGPAWSPDGTWIAYTDSTGGLRVVAPDGSRDGRIASGNRPAWSADGSHLAYDRGGSIYVARADGSGERRLAAGEQATWSPDGRWLSLVREGAAYLVRTDGADELRLGPGAVTQWSPAGTEFALLDSAGVLRVVSLSTGRTRRVAEDVEAAAMSPDWRRVATVLRVGRRSEVYAGEGAYHSRRTASQCHLYTANCVDGTDRADRIDGTAARDVIFPGAGDDRVRSRAGDDRIDTAYGRDHVEAGAGNDVVFTHGNDDRLSGGPGRDYLYPGNGEDTAEGGRGRDWIVAGGDGRVDRVRCGPGRDRVIADAVDRVARDCETVRRP
jgi:RTX calcium-binding nonapeptide repeat (4 copies)/WD40-like Beta Propeller Repeat